VSSPRLVIVTGSGRSGTSTVAGTLKRLGVHLPQPEKPADDANPRGFYETQWVNDFHKSILDPIPVRTGDSRPGMAEQAASAASDPDVVDQLRTWLAGQLDHPQVLVKDPRAFWVHDLWRTVATDLGLDLSFLTMVRHPAEVMKSRESAFLGDKPDEFRRQREVSNVAGWCNVAFESERATRGDRRCFVRYDDLVTDWRGVVQQVVDHLGLEVDADVADPEAPHPVDDFVDPGLHRSQVSWDQVDVPEPLRDVAERTWQAVNVLVAAPHDQGAVDDLAGLHAGYVRLHEFAAAMALDDLTAAEVHVRERVRAKLGRRHRKQLRSLRRRLRTAEKGVPG